MKYKSLHLNMLYTVIEQNLTHTDNLIKSIYERKKIKINHSIENYSLQNYS